MKKDAVYLTVNDGDAMYVMNTHVFCECGREAFQINALEYVCSCGKTITMGV